MPERVLSSGAGRLLRFDLPCHIEAVRDCARAVCGFLASMAVSSEEMLACELALVEAANNAVLYATSARQKTPVQIELIVEPHLLEIQIVDHTPGFDWPENPALPASDAEHGRGLFIIHSLMDKVTYLRGREENRLILQKKRPNAAAALGDAGASSENQELSASNADAFGPLLATEHKLALSEHLLNKISSELYQHVVQARVQKEELDNRLLAHELAIAKRIQESLLPKAFPALPGYQLSGFCRSARQVGGDFYDVITIAPGTALLVVADVMGKGVPAALFAATLRTLLRTTAEWTHNPAELLSRVNKLMYDELSGVDMFITALLALADVHMGTLSVASAGHCPMLLATTGGQGAVVSPEGMPLGILQEARFAEQKLPLHEIRRALLYSDGVTEARDASGELFGEGRLAAWLRNDSHEGQNIERLLESLLAELSNFHTPDALRDDQTFLLLAQTPASTQISSAPERLATTPSAHVSAQDSVEPGTTSLQLNH